jgi:predicted CXXCH cytochrome family protein
MNVQKVMKITRVSALVLVTLGIGLNALILWEGSSAREDAPALEASVAQWLLHYTVPANFRAMKNPLDVGSASAEVEAGHAVYTQKCEICHAYDGGGKTEIGSGEYPRPPDLRSAAVQRMSDGELFYHLKNGIRHTGMPAWTLPNRKLWQLSAYLRHLPRVAPLSPEMAAEQLPSATEWNVGCERCHGPGSDHVEHPGKPNIVNPAKLNYVQASDTCIQCHSQGQPLSNPIKGKYYDWPVGFHMGKQLVDFWRLEKHKLGELSFTHFPDGTAHKNRRQGNDFVQSLMYTRGVTCFSCHDAHGTHNDAMLIKPVKEVCSTCHGPNTQNGPHAPTLEAHTHHAAGSVGSECAACHMPKIEQTIADVNVRAHTFRFITPAESEAMKIPNACNLCHGDKTTAWATAALKGWGDRSPWRVAQSAPPAAESREVKN